MDPAKTLPNSVFSLKDCTFNHAMCHCSFDTLPDTDLLFTACCVISVFYLSVLKQVRAKRGRTCSACVDRISSQGFYFKT